MSWAAPTVGLDCLFRGERCLYEWSSTSTLNCPSAEDGLEVKCSVTENTKVSGRKRKHLLRFTTQLVRTKRVQGDLFASSVPWSLCVQSRLCCTSACSVVKRLYRGTFVSGGGIQTRGFVWKFLLATCMRSVCRLGQSNSREN